MPSKKFHSGSPLGSIRDSRWLNFVNAGAEIAHRIGYEGGDVTVDPGRTSVLVRNSTGEALERFSIVGISDVLIAPDANESEFLNHFALDADTPDTDRDGPGRIAVLQAPLADEKIGPALLWGMTAVKIDLPDNATYTAASLINGDATKLDADDDGDIVVVWHEEGPGEKWALVNLGGGGGGGGGGTTLADGCECDDDLLAEGVELAGSPTVCCFGHEKLTVDLGEVLGVKTLFHAGGDIWSTFNAEEELDNPVEIECYPDSDLYDVVLTLTSTGATITFVARGELNCNPICVVYEKIGTFACKGANQFRRVKFSGVKGMELPGCVCLLPVPRWGAGLEREPIEACDVCEVGSLTIAAYASVEVNVSGDGDCEQLNGNYIGPRSPVFCIWGEQVIEQYVQFETLFCNGHEFRITLAESGGDVSVNVSWVKRFIDDPCPFGAQVAGSPVVIPGFCEKLTEDGFIEVEVEVPLTGIVGPTCSGTGLVRLHASAPPAPGESGHCDGCEAEE